MALADGTVFANGNLNILTTSLPDDARAILAEIIDNYHPDYVVDILNSMKFVKVPFLGTDMIPLTLKDRLECGSSSYTDPLGWPF
jgi:hypothetical protein